jgi:hypothetical protein
MKRLAGCWMTISRLRAAVLSLLRRRKKRLLPFRDLPTFRSGGHLVDIANREALYDAMESRWNSDRN